VAQVRLAPGASVAVLSALAATALLTRSAAVAALVAALLLAACFKASWRLARLYVAGAVISGLGVLVLSPFLQATGSHPLWTGPTLPVLGPLDVTQEELRLAALNALRLTAVGLAFAAYALLVDHDALVRGVRVGRRSALVVALATRLVPSLQADGVRYAEAVRGRGLELNGVRARARLLSPLVAGSLERALSVAEAMEARGFGRPGATRAPRPPWRTLDRAAVAAATLLAVGTVLWL
jgi:energy-coupling factor transport system permease protein